MFITLSNGSQSIRFKALENSDVASRNLRYEKVKLLNGGVYVHNSGMTRADNDLTINALLSKSELDTILELADDGETLNIFAPDGVYTGLIVRVSPQSWPVTITITIESVVALASDIIYPPYVPPTPSISWTDYTSDQYWVSFPSSATTTEYVWDGSKWDAVFTGSQYNSGFRCDTAPLNWWSGYRPDYFRITFSHVGEADAISVRCWNGSSYEYPIYLNDSDANDASGITQVMGAYASDILFLNIVGGGVTLNSVAITKIEFGV